MSETPEASATCGDGLASALAVAAAAAAVLVLPEALTGWRPGAQDSLAAASLVFVTSVLVMRALACRRRIVLAVGAVLVLGGLALDTTGGFDGWVRIEPGQAVKNLDEGGGALRPLGFELTLEALEASGIARLLVRTGSGDERLTLPANGVRILGVRLGGARLQHTGRALSLLVRLRSGGRERTVTVRPGDIALAEGLEIVLEEYHPDFTLEGGVPRTRSAEPRNPAALFSIRRGSAVFPAFVIRGVPDLHRVEGLGVSLALLAVEPEQIVAIPVGRHPGAALAALGCALLIVGAFVEAGRP